MEWAFIDWTPLVLAQAEATDANAAIGEGMTIAAVGIVIVFSALMLITLFIASLPRILRVVNHVWPEAGDGHRESGHPESQTADDSDVLAAIGFVLHTEFQRQLTAEASPANKD
jgi:Na+-transporting methylmalonyl-CoA/oxaloacetate decarboxylase gamma subunit